MDLSDRTEYLTPNIKILLEDINYEIEGKMIHIPKYVAWNGVSLPTPLLFIVDGDRFGRKVDFPSLVHDYFYDKAAPEQIDRKTADDVFYKLLIEEGNNKTYSMIAWLTVRLFGTLDYRKETWIFDDYDVLQKNIRVQEIPSDNISSLDTYFYVWILIYVVIFIIFLIVMVY